MIETDQMPDLVNDGVGEADAADLDLYQRTSNTMRRHLESVGLERVAKDCTPALVSYVAETYGKGGR